MNCIFICLFNDEKYIDLFYLLLESIFIYGNLNDDTDILLYTSTSFMNLIKKSHLFNEEKVKFEINDTYDNIYKARKARLDIFNLDSIKKYNKILYLDTNTIVKGDIKKVFDVCKEDILYVLEEGYINCDITDKWDYWGKLLFGDKVNNYQDKTAFTSGVLLFNNCKNINDLFNKINRHISFNTSYTDILPYYEQPYIVYESFKCNLYNNKILKLLVINNDNNIYSNKVIHHFSDDVKIINIISHFLNNIKDYTITNNINVTKIFIDKYLLSIINDSGELLEGNIFTLQHTKYTDIFLNKAKNISNLVLNKNIRNVMEIGFNSGFSTLLMLISNPKMHITCIDLGEHKYTLPCYEKLKEFFGDRINIILGDSTKTLKNIHNKYDLIHIDGGHSFEVANSDITNSYRLSKKGSILIMDDYDSHSLHKLWNNYIEKYNLCKLDIKLYHCIYQDIKCVV